MKDFDDGSGFLVISLRAWFLSPVIGKLFSIMVSITFFVFVALILVVGFFAATWRRKNRVPLDPDGQPERNSRTPDPNDRLIESNGDIKGGILPADNRLSEDNVDDDELIK